MKLFSPAKLNLFLRIMGKRPDGYHELASLFQAISLGDQITLSLGERDTLSCSDPRVPCTRENLAWRAVELFRKKTGFISPVVVDIEKRIPMEAGLGGGSSNAATVLWGLNQLGGVGVSDEELQLWSSEMGMDVPFFFSGGTAYCTGRGECVEDLLPLQAMRFSIFKMSEGLSTAKIYQTFRVEESSSRDPKELLEGFYRGKGEFVNDLEGPAFRLLPKLGEMKRELEGEVQSVFMTGSGTALVSVVESGEVKMVRRGCGQKCWY
ncbi:MAG: 4-diphosphocytidyl-2-C-methyl-D-erythritol kinase [Chlamydiae bacterium]|nr:4-diphosphocytidyl-2-C-methyl-D-erythritol kinase [Chlamydiota bacterium]